MKNLGNILKDNRLKKGYKIRELSSLSRIDQALISKYESGDRIPSEDHLHKIIASLELPDMELKKYWLAEKILKVVQYDTAYASEAWEVAESRIQYLQAEPRGEVVTYAPELQASIVEIDNLQLTWSKSRPLGGVQLSKMKDYFITEYTYESNRIEGSTLTLQETSLVVNQGLTIGGKSMKEHLEAVNHSEAAEFIFDLATNKEDLTERVLLELHSLVLKSIDRENAGRYRKVQVMITGSEHAPPQPYMVSKMMEEFFIFYTAHKNHLHPVILAAEMHERLVSIHPFIDGNGRTARLIMNLILLRNGYTIVNLKGDLDSRMHYYKALESVQIDNDTSIFHSLIVSSAITSLRRHLELV